MPKLKAQRDFYQRNRGKILEHDKKRYQEKKLAKQIETQQLYQQYQQQVQPIDIPYQWIFESIQTF